MAATLLCFSSALPVTRAFVRNSAAKSRAFGFLSTSPRLEKTLSISREKFPVIQATMDKMADYDVLNKERGLESYAPQEFEGNIYKWWEDAGCFEPDSKQKHADNKKQPYVLPMPPPNVTGRLHMGHAIFVALQDVLARFHRMRGRPVLWLPGKRPASVPSALISNNRH